MVSGVVHQDAAHGDVISGVGGFVDDLGVGGEIRSAKNAILFVLLRLVSKDQDDFALRVYTLVIVVVIFRGSDAVACENEWRVKLNIFGETEGDEIFFRSQSRPPAAAFITHRV